MGKSRKGSFRSKSSESPLTRPYARLVNRLAEVVLDGAGVLKSPHRELVLGGVADRLNAACPKGRSDPGPSSDEHGD